MKLHEDIKQLLPGLHGWCDRPKATTLVNMILATKPEVVVEFGIWGGRSFFPMALALKQLGHGKIIGVDPWKVEASVEGQTTDPDRKHWQETNHEVVYQHFMHTLTRLGLEPYCEIHRCKSEEIELPGNVGLFHLDQNHGEQAFNEMVRCAPKIAPYGFVVLDDLSWSGGHVQRTADWLKSNGYLELHTLGTGAVFLKG